MISSSQMTNSGERIERTMLHRILQKTTTLFLGTPSENWLTSIWESVDRSWVIAFSSLYIFAMFIFYILRLDSEHTWKPFFFFILDLFILEGLVISKRHLSIFSIKTVTLLVFFLPIGPQRDHTKGENILSQLSCRMHP